MSDKLKTESLDEKDLQSVQGGVAMLLPAVQAAREAARRKSPISNDLAIKEAETTGTVKKI